MLKFFYMTDKILHNRYRIKGFLILCLEFRSQIVMTRAFLRKTRFENLLSLTPGILYKYYKMECIKGDFIQNMNNNMYIYIHTYLYLLSDFP